jgi:hypothetical protein
MMPNRAGPELIAVNGGGYGTYASWLFSAGHLPAVVAPLPGFLSSYGASELNVSHRTAIERIAQFQARVIANVN